jgi:predicted TIM-barrel fold metal-dependent hydrolase
MDRSIPIFDIDTHWTETPDLWTSRAPAKYKDQVLHVRTKANGHDAWFFGNQQVAMTGPSVVDLNMEKHLGAFTLPRYDLMHRAGTYAAERVAYMDEAGVGTQLAYPNVIGFGGQAMMKLDIDPELRLWHVQAYNDAILDLQNESGGRILPQAALPLWDIEASLIELHRARNMGLTGVAMSHSPEDFGREPLAHPAWEPFFATCQDLDLPINFHQGSGSFEGDLSKWWGTDKTVAYEDGTLNSQMIIWTSPQLMLGIASDMANLIMTGLCEQFPKLKFVCVESGIAWVPFTLKALEYQWKEMMSPKFAVNFKRSPTEMFREQIYCSYWFEGKAEIDYFISELGADHLMIETDFPHPTSLFPNSVLHAKIDETLGHLARPLQEDILYRNAEKLYGVEVYRPLETADA